MPPTNATVNSECHSELAAELAEIAETVNTPCVLRAPRLIVKRALSLHHRGTTHVPAA